MLFESAVIAAVCAHLKAQGYSIRQQSAEHQQGDDIVAVRGDDVLRIEAKGATSSKPTSKRYGKPFNWNQVQDHVAMAFYRAAKMRQDGGRVGIALPKNADHEKAVAPIQQALDDLGVTTYWVDDDRLVEESGDSDRTTTRR